MLLVAIPLLLFPYGYLPWVGLGLLVIGLVLRGIGTGVWFARTPLNRPAAVLLIMTVVSLYPSVDLDFSMPKFYGITLGIFIFFATVSNVNSERNFWLGIWLLIVSMVVVSLLSMVGTDWTIYKFPALEQIYGMMPRVIRGVQTSFGASDGFHSNEVGGTLAFLLPLPLALILGAPFGLLRKTMLGVVVLLGFGMLMLTASRSAFIGVAVASLVLIIWRWRRTGLATLFVALATVGVALSANASAIFEFLLRTDVANVASGGATMAARIEIWDRTRYMIEDFPFTGIGLNTFPIMLNTLYPSFLAGADAGIPHAHNIFLQTAADLGLGGFLGFLGLWACTAHAGWTTYRQAAMSKTDHRPAQAAIVGILVGILSYLIYGLTDAITLGAKPTVLLWLMIGLLAGIHRITFNDQARPLVWEQKAFDSSPFVRRAVRFLIVTFQDCYWIITFALVGAALLVVAISVSGRIL